jgi:hypothetical protein
MIGRGDRLASDIADLCVGHDERRAVDRVRGREDDPGGGPLPRRIDQRECGLDLIGIGSVSAGLPSLTKVGGSIVFEKEIVFGAACATAVNASVAVKPKSMARGSKIEAGRVMTPVRMAGLQGLCPPSCRSAVLTSTLG